MTIKFSDGRAVEAVLMSRTETEMRVMMEGADDVTEFFDRNGTWVSANCEPVVIEFAWQQADRKPVITEADCCCSPELAARLMQLLLTDSDVDSLEDDALLEQSQHLTHSAC